MFDIDDFFSELNLDDFRFLMTRDFVFVDYFNKYCFLPIFGQKIAFSKRNGRYIFDPQQRRKNASYTLSNDIVCGWLYKRRFPLFTASKIANECKLCTLLIESPVYHALLASKQSEGMENILDAREVLIARVGGVAKMAKFREFVSCSKYAKHLIAFWMDAENLRKIRAQEDKDSGAKQRQMSSMLLRAIQLKYYRTTSRYFLTTKVLGNQMNYGVGDEYRCCDLVRTMRLQIMVLEILRNYWLPKYVISLSKTTIECQTMFPAEEQTGKQRRHKSMRKSAAAKRLRRSKKTTEYEEEESNMLRYMLGRCSMVRFKAPSKENIRAIEFSYDDEEKNVLLEEIDKEEEWSDTSTKLGWSEVDYIHHHFFGDDDENKDHVSYKTTQNKNDISTTGSALSLLRSSTGDTLSANETRNSQGLLSNLGTDSNAELQENDESSNDDGKDIAQRTPTLPLLRITSLAKITYSTSTGNKQKERFQGSSATSSMSESTGKTTTGSDRTSDSGGASDQIGNVTYAIRLPNNESSCSSTSSSQFSAIPRLATDLGRMSENYLDVEDEDEIKWDTEGHFQALLSEILISDELSGFVYRQFLNTCLPISPSGDTVSKELDETDAESLVCFLDYWKDIENYRRQHPSLSDTELSNEHERLLRRYFCNECTVVLPGTQDLRQLGRKAWGTSPSHITHRLLEIQVQLQKNLVRKWIAFASEDRKDFYDSARPMMWKIGKRRSSYPNCPEEHRRLPILRVEVGDIINQHRGDVVSEKIEWKTSSEERMLYDFLGHKHSTRLKYRTSRAVYLLMMCVQSSPKKYDSTYGYYGNNFDSIFCAEVESDTDGAMMEIPRKYVRLPDFGGKTLAKLSAREYPRHGIDYSKYKEKDDTFRLIRKPLYMRPITKGGIRIERPREKPKNLAVILKDPVHYMFFKRFMKMHDSEAPLLFWKSVDLLKRTEKRSVRQRKAKGIMKKFFSRIAGGGILLQCDADLIKDLGKIKKVTTSMLAEAQNLIFNSMEKNWGQRYMDTFPEDPPDIIEEQPETPQYVIHETHTWRVLGDFIRRAACFIKSMKNPTIVQEFRNYIVRISDEYRATGDSETALHQTAIIKGHGFETTMRIAKYEVAGKKIALDCVTNDLALLMEISRFVALMDNAKEMIQSGSFEQSDLELAVAKARCIINCFFDSNVPPRLRVNVRDEEAEKIMKSFSSGEIFRGLFHNAILEIFPLLLHFWTKYRKEKHKYKSRKILRLERHEGARRRRNTIMAMRRKSLGTKLPEGEIKPKVSETDFFYNSFGDPPYEKVKGIVLGDPTILHYSLQHGLKLIIPPRRAVRRLSDSDGVFLKVWTRGAKAVNVLAAGSNPTIFDTGEKGRALNVFCDLIE